MYGAQFSDCGMPKRKKRRVLRRQANDNGNRPRHFFLLSFSLSSRVADHIDDDGNDLEVNGVYRGAMNRASLNWLLIGILSPSHNSTASSVSSYRGDDDDDDDVIFGGNLLLLLTRHVKAEKPISWSCWP